MGLNMKTELTDHGTWLCTGNYNGRRFIAAGHSRTDAMAEGVLAMNMIIRRMASASLPSILMEQAQ